MKHIVTEKCQRYPILYHRDSINSISMRGVYCLDGGFFVSCLSLSGSRNSTLILHLCEVVDFPKGSPGKFLEATRK